MKKLFLLLSISLLSSSLFGSSFFKAPVSTNKSIEVITPAKKFALDKSKKSGVNFITYSEALDLHKKKTNTKPYFIMVSATHCGYCDLFLKNLKKSKVVQNILRDKFIPVILDKDLGGLPKNLKTSVTPTFFVLSPLSMNSLIPNPIYGASDMYEMQIFLLELDKQYQTYISKLKKNGVEVFK